MVTKVYETVNPSWLLSQSAVIEAFSLYSLQFMMIKRLRDDVLVWCNDLCAKAVGSSPPQMIGRKCIDFWPDAADYHADDLEVAEKGPRLGYDESSATAHSIDALRTNKWHMHIDGEDYIFVCAIDLTDALRPRQQKQERGRVFNEIALRQAKQDFEALHERFPQPHPE